MPAASPGAIAGPTMSPAMSRRSRSPIRSRRLTSSARNAAPVAAGGSITAADHRVAADGRAAARPRGGRLPRDRIWLRRARAICGRIGDYESDPVVVAERLIGAPWLAGGRTAHGIDSAALVQLALGLCGLPAPRFADQLASFGAPLAEGAPARRGDLVLFEGGAGLMIDDLMMIHASQAAGKVAVEPASLYAVERRRLPL